MAAFPRRICGIGTGKGMDKLELDGRQVIANCQERTLAHHPEADSLLINAALGHYPVNSFLLYWNTMMNRRDVFKAASAMAWPVRSEAKKRIATVITEYRLNSHADVIAGRLI